MPFDNSVLPTHFTPALNWNGVCFSIAIHQINETHAVELEERFEGVHAIAEFLHGQAFCDPREN